MDDGEDSPVAADPAFVLEPGVPYVRRWAQARDAEVPLRAELYRLGLVELADQVRADVNVFGVGVVDLGSVSPQTAHALAELLAGAEVTVARTRDGRVAAVPRPRSASE